MLWEFTFIPEVHSVCQVWLHLFTLVLSHIRHFIDKGQSIQHNIVLPLSKLRNVFYKWLTFIMYLLDLFSMDIVLQAFECLALICVLSGVGSLGHLRGIVSGSVVSLISIEY